METDPTPIEDARRSYAGPRKSSEEFGENLSIKAGVYGDHESIKEQDAQESDPSIHSFPIRLPGQKWSPDWWASQANKRLGCQLRGVHEPLVSASSGVAAAMEVGGDNYSLDYGRPVHFIEMDRFLVKRGVPVMIWGASIGPFSSDPEFEPIILDHLRQLPGVFVRETPSVEYLAEHGVEENVHLVGDPSFVMDLVEPDKDRIGFEIAHGMVGINFSPLMAKFVNPDLPDFTRVTETHLEEWKAFCVDCVVNVMQQSGREALLVPHVGSSLRRGR